MSAELVLQAAVHTLLRADTPLCNLLASSVIENDAGKAVYDSVPQVAESESSTAFPYVVIGECTVVNADTDDMDGQEHVITLHTWSRYRGKKEVKQIHAAIYAALHDAALTVTGYTAVYCFFESSEVFGDPDGLTQHGVSRYRVLTFDT
jgi:hypothetical protein